MDSPKTKLVNLYIYIYNTYLKNIYVKNMYFDIGERERDLMGRIIFLKWLKDFLKLEKDLMAYRFLSFLAKH